MRGHRRWSRLAAAVLLGTAGLNGCVAYVPVGGAEPPGAGARVRLDLATPMDVPMGPVTANEVRTLTGELVGADSATLTVAALRAVSAGGHETLGPGLSVVLPRQAVREIRTPRISPTRSAGFVGVLAGLSLVIVGALSVAGSDGGGDGGSGGNPK